MHNMARIMKLITLTLVISILATACGVSEGGAQPTAAPSGEATAVPTVEALAETAEPTDEPIVVDELVDVDDLMINQELDDQGWWNILLLGSDSRNMDNYYGLTDSIVILSVYPADGEAKLTSIMRDTWVDIYGVGGRKINSANVYGGPDLIMRTVNEYFGMNLTDYALVSMEALADVIDYIGGIDIAVTETEMSAINTQLTWDAADFTLNDATPLGTFGDSVHLTGNQALAFARIRKLDSDYVRTERQRTVLIAMADKLQGTDARTLSAVVLKLAGYVQTNLSIAQMVSLATIGLGIDMQSVEQLRLPADGTFQSDTYDGVWSIRADFEANQQILNDFIYGAD
jgi:LCP family protein required for cell wall assembly